MDIVKTKNNRWLMDKLKRRRLDRGFDSSNPIAQRTLYNEVGFNVVLCLYSKQAGMRGCSVKDNHFNYKAIYLTSFSLVQQSSFVFASQNFIFFIACSSHCMEGRTILPMYSMHVTAGEGVPLQTGACTR